MCVLRKEKMADKRLDEIDKGIKNLSKFEV
jgi:hypothetical protein